MPRPGVAAVNNNGVTAQIPLHSRDGSISAYATIDASDADWISERRWSLSGGYARRRIIVLGKPKNIYLHRELLGLVPGDGIEGDHINRDRLDCRRSNLRAIPASGNRQNHPGRSGTSRHRGVSWSKKERKWVVQMHIDGRATRIGAYLTENEAAEVAQATRLRVMAYATD